jgi:hypothetical protein
MHVHPPKPLHGWKEFLNEIFVIVVGVLIALGFEQVVEELHWRHKVHEGEERLKEEMAYNYRSALNFLVITPCINARYDQLQDRLIRSGATLDPAPRESAASRMAALGVPGRVFNFSYVGMSTSVWEALNADETAQHMPQQMQRRLGFIMRNAANFAERGRTRRSIDMLALPLPLDPAARTMLASELQNSRDTLNGMALIAMNVAGGVRDTGYAPSASEMDAFVKRDPSGMIQLCRAQKMPLADWRDALDRVPPVTTFGI